MDYLDACSLAADKVADVLVGELHGFRWYDGEPRNVAYSVIEAIGKLPPEVLAVILT